MTKVDFSAAREQAKKEGVLGKGDYLKLKEGDNRIRLMSECLAHPGEYMGKSTFKWLCHVLDRADGKIKPFFMPDTINQKIEVLQRDADYRFDEVPMPYDITINAKGAGTKEVEYSVIPRPASPLTPAEKALLVGTTPIQELQKKLREQQPASPVQVDSQEDDGPEIQMDMPA